jgi:hypothetical protein
LVTLWAFQVHVPIASRVALRVKQSSDDIRHLLPALDAGDAAGSTDVSSLGGAFTRSAGAAHQPILGVEMNSEPDGRFFLS